MSSTIKTEREDGGPDAYKCDNCGKIHTFDQLDNISDLSERVEAGGTMPAGECPNDDCGGALCYPVEEEKREPREYGKVVWTAEDVQTLREDLTDDQAEAFLDRNAGHLRDRLIELGWDVMGTLLDIDDEIPARCDECGQGPKGTQSEAHQTSCSLHPSSEVKPK